MIDDYHFKQMLRQFEEHIVIKIMYTLKIQKTGM